MSLETETKAETLKQYISRLDQGESLDSVQADFVKNFSGVSAGDIARAEEAMIQSGTPVNHMQKLCDIHSALFHGASQQERMQNAENAVRESLRNEQLLSADSASISGHPLNILTLENNELMNRLNRIIGQLQDGDFQDVPAELADLKAMEYHYDKKDELILPVLKRHGVSGPADVMWNVDSDLRKQLGALIKAGPDADHQETAQLIKRMKEMIFKEDKILYPLAESRFTAEEWQKAALDFPRFGYSYLHEIPVWKDAQPAAEREYRAPVVDAQHPGQTQIVLNGGVLSLEQLEGVLRTLPLELTFLDKDSVNRYFSENSTLFPRAMSALNHSAFECHPPKVIPIVQNVIRQLSSGEKDSISFVTAKRGRKVLVRYLAVRGIDGSYLGTLEAVEELADLSAGASTAAGSR